MKKILAVALTGATLLPLLALAQAVPPVTIVTSFTNVTLILGTLIGWIFTIFMIIAVIIVIFAAFNYLTAGGDDEKIGTAKKQFIYAAVAIAVALVAKSVQAIVTQLISS